MSFFLSLGVFSCLFFSLWGSSRVFFLSLWGIFSCLFFSLGVFSWNFGGVLVGRDPQMCAFSPSFCRGENPGGLQAAPEREKKNENGGGRGKKARNFGRSGGGRSRGGRSGGDRSGERAVIWTTHNTHPTHTNTHTNPHTHTNTAHTHQHTNTIGPNSVGPNSVGTNSVGPNSVGPNSVGA